MQAYLAWADSETVDEPRHVVAALAYTRNGTFRLYNVNPPLPRLVQGIFLLFVPLDTSMIDDPPQHGQRIEALVAEMFLQVHLDRYRLILFLARLGTVAFALLGGVLLFAWGNSAFGKPCGLLALFAWCCNPSILAHGHLATPDVPAATLALAAALALRAYLVSPSVPRAVLTGFTLGLALLSKFTLLLLLPLWLLFWLFALLRRRQERRGIPGHGPLAAAIMLLTVNAGYVFQDTGRPVGSFQFVSKKFGATVPPTMDDRPGITNVLQGTFLGALPVPLPAPFVEGIDLQARDFDQYAARNSTFFMAGQWINGGSYFYYLYGLVVKSPLPLFGLLAAAGVLLVHRRCSVIDLLLLVVIPLALLIFVSSQRSMNKHVRYVLPMLPFLVLLVSAAGRAWQGETRTVQGVVGLLAVLLLLVAARAMRDPLAYFNELAGGPRGGVYLLAGSNLDWGQGGHRLREWLEAHRDFRLDGLACYGTDGYVFADLPCPLPPLGPGKGGIPRDPARRRKLGPHPGRYAVSVRVLQGDVASLGDPTGKVHRLHERDYTYFQRFEPVACPSGEPRAGLDGRRSWRGRATTQPRELPVRATVPWLAGMEPRWKEQAQVGDALPALLFSGGVGDGAGLARCSAFQRSGNSASSPPLAVVGKRVSTSCKYAHGSTSSRLHVEVKLIITAAIAPPCGEPMNSQFFRPIAIRFISRSATLLSMSRKPASV